jgi:hypothetical protein
MKTSQNTEQGIYIDLDCLLDTRLGTCTVLKPDGIGDILSNNYLRRTMDVFHGIDKKEFNNRYNKRDVDVLKNSYMTNIVKVLNPLIRDSLKLLGAQPIYNTVALYVNLHPYKLTDDEIEDIVLCIKRWTDNLIPINIINLSNDDLTVRWIGSHIQTLIKYDIHEWMTKQIKNFNKQQLTEVNAIAPALHIIELDEKAIDDLIKKINDPNVETVFNAAEKMATPLISLSLIDVSYFSIVDPEIILS